MRFRCVAILLIASLGGCSWATGPRKYTVFFEPYSTSLGPRALDTIHNAAGFAKAHPVQAVAVEGYAAPANPRLQVDGLSAQRADVVRKMLVYEGVGPERITTEANGISDPEELPNVAVRRVDIRIGK